MAATKLSEFQIKRVIRHYAEGVQPAAAARQMRLSYPTVRGLYDLIRKRMLRLTLYRTYEAHFALMEDVDEHGGYWDERPLLDYLKTELGRRRGVTPETLPFHQAELIYRFEDRQRVGEHFAQSHYTEILALIRLSGPLNRPVEAADARAAVSFIVARELDRLERTEREVVTSVERMFAQWDIEDPGWRDDEPDDGDMADRPEEE